MKITRFQWRATIDNKNFGLNVGFDNVPLDGIEETMAPIFRNIIDTMKKLQEENGKKD